MNVWLADRPGPPLERGPRRRGELAAVEVRAVAHRRRGSGGDGGARARPSPRAGPPAVVMLNAGIEAGGKLFSDADTWRRILDTNLWGVINGIHAFAPGMIAGGKPGASHRHRLEAGHHHAAGQRALQRLEGGGEGGDRGARPRAAQPRGLPDHARTC